MKLYLVGLSMLAVSSSAFAQPKVITQAIISTSINVIAPEEEDSQNQGAGGMNFRNMMDGETKATIWLKNDMVKTVLKSDVFHSTIIRNNATKITTTILEIMGTKQGFYISDSEQLAMRDSMIQKRRKKDSSATTLQQKAEPAIEISYASDTRKISGYECKKAYMITTHLLGTKDTITVWYNPDLKFQNTSSPIGMTGFGNMGNVNGLDKLDGFAMRYEINLPRSRRMEVEVTKIDTVKEITDKEFEIPKDIEIKPMKEMRNMFGRGNFPPRPNQ